jgi:hypothetical protein
VPGRLDIVQVATSRKTIEIPWASRQDLVERLREHPSGAPLVASFEALGTSAPVPVVEVGQRALLETLELWIEDVERQGLPTGLRELYVALLEERDDFVDRGEEN